MEVIHNAEFLMLPCDEVCQLLASDDLNVPNEETIFEALVKWAKHDLTMRRSYLPKLLAHIKLPLMAPQVSGSAWLQVPSSLSLERVLTRTLQIPC